MSIDKVEARVAAAMRHSDISWIFAGLSSLPKQYRDSPAVLRSLMMAAAQGDPNLTNTEPFRAAHAALTEVQGARELRDKIGELYHNPKVQLAAGDKLDWYMAHPSAAYEALMSNPKLAAELGADLAHEVKLAALGARDFAAEHGIAEPAAVAAKSIPTDPDKASSEYDTLIKKSVTGKLTAEETERMQQLAGAKVERENASAVTAAASLTEPAPKPGAYEALIKKSVAGPLSDTEQTQLHELATARAEAAGLLEQPEGNGEGNGEG